jgi:Fic family protein
MYCHQLKEWPNFILDQTNLTPLLADVRYLQDKLLGRLSALGFDLKQEATLKMVTHDILKTSEIEGVFEVMIDAMQGFRLSKILVFAFF